MSSKAFSLSCRAGKKKFRNYSLVKMRPSGGGVTLVFGLLGLLVFAKANQDEDVMSPSSWVRIFFYFMYNLFDLTLFGIILWSITDYYWLLT